MSFVKLAIRVRPRFESEKLEDINTTPVVRVEDDNTVAITNLKVSTIGAGDSRARITRFTADYCFDSSCPGDIKYASQDTVYHKLAPEVLKSLSCGRSVCVLAYGQSATGKTYTMMGTERDPGIIPRLCEDISSKPNSEVTVSYLEIYNERVHDLLSFDDTDQVNLDSCSSLPRRDGNHRKNLRVREHPSSGPYVQNLRQVRVSGTEALLTLVRKGTSRRRTASTGRNHNSSRSHALLELKTDNGTLYLADLAGSERANSECSFRGRQKEGANINKSLVALSNVIAALGTGGVRSRYVPYRNSVLTWLLKDSFTGGDAIFIIATVSGQSASYGSTLSTLRWASRARKLKTPRQHINHGTIRIATLLRALAQNHIQYIPETSRIVCDPKYWRYIASVEAITEKSKINHCSIMHGQVNPESTNTLKDDKAIEIMGKEHLVCKRLDKIFGPVLYRTSSGNDLTTNISYKNKQRKYRSHEILPLKQNQSYDMIKKDCDSSYSSKDALTVSDSSVKSETPTKRTNIVYHPDNRRALIVASVTERLYNKVKKKEEKALATVESIVEKKVMEPLNELNLCSNARQRLVSLSHKALRKRRIGVPVFTQTSFPVIRVKDQSIDVQKDLDTFYIKKNNENVLLQNVYTETNPISPRYKEASVGSNFGCLYITDNSTLTDPINEKISFGINTEQIIKTERYTQTSIKPPPRKKRNCNDVNNSFVDRAAVVNISISQYGSDEGGSLSEDSLETIHSNENSFNTTPDLLSNTKHTANDKEKCSQQKSKANPKSRKSLKLQNSCKSLEDEDFIDSESCSNALPKVSATPGCKLPIEDFSDIILGKNICNPEKSRLAEEKKQQPKCVTFEEKKFDHTTSTIGTQTLPIKIVTEEKENNPQVKINNKKIDSNSLHFEMLDELNQSSSESSSNIDATECNLKPSFFAKKRHPSFLNPEPVNFSEGSMYDKRRPRPPTYYRSRSSSPDGRETRTNKFIKCSNDNKATHFSQQNKPINAKQKYERKTSPVKKENKYIRHYLKNFESDIAEPPEKSEADYKREFEQKKKYFENFINENCNCYEERFRDLDNFYKLEKNLIKSCDRLEKCAATNEIYFKNLNQARSYLSLDLRRHENVDFGPRLRRRNPSEYLQSLIETRKQIIEHDKRSEKLSSFLDL